MRINRKHLLRAGLSAGLGLVLIVALTAETRWRVHVVIHKASGALPEVTWLELVTLLRPGSRLYLEDVARTASLYESVRNPHADPEDVGAGEAIYRRECALCHGTRGEGGSGPNLRHPPHEQGSSDWALYRVLRDGIDGTAMPAAPVEGEALWQLIAYVQEVRREVGPPLDSARSAWAVAEVSSETLFEADRDSPNWLTYSGSHRSWRHSRLSQMTPANVGGLRVEWAFQLASEEPKVETTPLVVGGAMFLTEPDNRVVALDARTGVLRWEYRPRLADRLSLCCGRVNRGLAIHGSTLFLGTLDARLIALDAATGAVRWEATLAEPELGYSITSAPLVVGDGVIIGVAGGEFGIRGFVDAYDAATGARRWRFHTVPGPGEPGHETWTGESWRTGGGPAWLTGSYDRESDLLYVGVGNPGPLYDGTTRAGDNWYTNSVVALRARTGALAWHFQFTPHDLHDYDAVQVPLLVDAPFRGAARRLLLWANRNGFYYVLDRVTGEYLGSREFARQTWAEGIDSAGRPRRHPGAEPSRKGTLVYPSYLGATNWWSPAYNPATRMVYVPTREQGAVFFAEPADYRPGALYLGSRGEALFPGAITAVRALDAVSGELRWEHVFGAVPDEAEMFSVGGVLSTAGDLVFAGAATDFVALDARDGAVRWRFNTGGLIHAAPITWEADGRQRITLAAGRTLFTFSLD